MAKNARSARGEIVDFDIIAIKSALAAAPVSVSTEERRKFIDTKYGVKPKPQNGLVTTAATAQSALPAAMMLAVQGAEVSAEVDVNLSELVTEEAVAQEPEATDLSSI